MDLHLKQWRSQQQHESEHQPSAAKIPKLLFEQSQTASAAALPLFASEPTSKICNFSGLPPDSSSKFPRMGSFFSLAQWQELELQALIYRYMLAGAAVPIELLQPIKKSLIHSPSYFLHHPLQHYSHYQPAWYWGRAAMDPEPGRCRRTDGKKWRCSRDVVVGHKYCERHMHRGRNRSRKPVEISTPNSTTTNTTTTTTSSLNFGGSGGCGGGVSLRTTTGPIGGQQPGVVANGPSFFLGSSPSTELLHRNHSSSNTGTENNNRTLFESQNGVGNNRSDGRVLRHFFDDWPRSLQEPETSGSNPSPMSSDPCLSISMPGNSSSDVSLKLSTGIEEEPNNRENIEREQPNLNWGSGWGGNPMGGPLAEVLRSSTSSSPTSVLYQLPRGGISS